MRAGSPHDLLDQGAALAPNPWARRALDGISGTLMLVQFAKRRVSQRIKSAVRGALQRHRFDAAMRRLLALAPGEIPDRELLEALRTAWGNEGFCANLPFLSEVAKRAATVD